MAERAYFVEEDWRITKTAIVWARTAEEAKDKYRSSATDPSDVEVLDDTPEPRACRAKREPSEDRP